MRMLSNAIKLPAARRARGATGLCARSQMGQPCAFWIPPWAKRSDRRMERRIAARKSSRRITPERLEEYYLEDIHVI